MRWWPFSRRKQPAGQRTDRASASAARRYHRFRPHLDVLEDRTLLATLTVTSDLDAGSGTLRDALLNANNGDDIVVDSSLSGHTIVLTTATLDVNHNVRILGLGADQLTVRNDGAFRAFTVTANATIEGLTIEGGTSGAGGIAVAAGVRLEVNASIIADHTANQGAGIDSAGDVRLRDSALIGNTALAEGGAIYVAAGGSLTLLQDTLSGNSSSGDGGAIRNLGSATIYSSTIAFNQASNGGGVANSGTLNLTNTLVASNSATGTGSDIQGTVTTQASSLVGVDPFLAPLQTVGVAIPFHPLQAGSPAINAGAANFNPNPLGPPLPPPNLPSELPLLRDQRGAARVQGGRVDIGAVEMPGFVVTPAAAEFLVNGTTAGVQETRVSQHQAVAMDAAGNFVVTWTSTGQDGDGLGVYARRFNAAGAPLGSEFLVNTITASDQFNPAVAVNDAGDFVIAWTSNGQDGSGNGVYAQRYDHDGNPLGGAFPVNQTTAGNQTLGALAMDAVGNFVVVWQGNGTADTDGIYARRFASNGTPLSDEFAVNTATANAQDSATVAMDPAGNFVVAWRSDGEDGSLGGIYARRYDRNGSAQDGPFLVNTFTAGEQSDPSVGMDARGNFVVAWQSDTADGTGNGSGIYAQRFDRTGAAQGSEFRVNTTKPGDQVGPSVAMDALGNFMVAWTSTTQDSGTPGVYGQFFHYSGQPVGGEQRVNTTTAGAQQYPSVALRADQQAVVIWSGNGAGDTDGVRARRLPIDLFGNTAAGAWLLNLPPANQPTQMGTFSLLADAADFFRVDLPTDGTLTVQVASVGVATRLTVLDENGRMLSRTDARSLTDPSDWIQITLPPSTYSIAVEGAAPGGLYALTATWQPGPLPLPVDPFNYLKGADIRDLLGVDVNDDGRQDIIAVDYATHHVNVLINSGNLAFTDIRSWPTGQGPIAVITTDLNNDGRPDLVVANQVDSTVSVLLGLGTGSFQANYTFAAGPSLVAIAAADVNGDGHVDLSTADATGTLHVLLADPTRAFDDPGRFALNPANDIPLGGSILALAAADLNLNDDNRPDLVVSTTGGLFVLFNNGAGTFAAPQGLPGDAGSAAVQVLDFDGGDQLDIVTPQHVYLGDGHGSFTDALNGFTASLPGNTTDIAAADLNLDGALDLIAVSPAAVLLSQGGQTSVAPSTPTKAIAVDINGDGRLDLVVADQSPGGISLFLNPGTGQFASGPNPANHVLTNIHQTPAVIDLDGDHTADTLIVNALGDLLWRRGRPDEAGAFDAPIIVNPGQPSVGFAVVNTPNGPVIASIDRGRNDELTLYRFQNGLLVPTGETLATGAIPAQVIVGDLNGGGEDLVVRTAAGDALSLFYFDAATQKFKAQPPLSVGRAISDVALQDFTGDGKLDILLTNQFAGSVTAIVNPGNGNFTPSPPAPPPVRNTYRAGIDGYLRTPPNGGPQSNEVTNGVVAADVNDDHVLDLITLNTASDPTGPLHGEARLGLLFGLGNGRFTNPQVAVDSNVPGGEALRTTFLNDDALPDLVVLTNTGINVYLGTGHGFSAQAITYDAGPQPSGLTLADANGDGQTDILVGNAFGDVLILLGRPGGTFQPYHAHDHIALAFADLDHDGRDDFVFGNQTLDRVAVEYGSPGHDFVQDGADGLLAPGAVQLQDLNGDDRPDLVIANTGGNAVLVFLGQEDGSFEAVLNPLTGRPGFSTGTAPTGITIQDVNGDQRLDLIVANSGSNDVSILLGQGEDDAWTLTDGPRVRSGGVAPVAASLADVTGPNGNPDGIADLVVANSQSDSVAILTGVGNGFFDDQPDDVRVLHVGSDPRQAFVGNVDGQPGLDLVSINAGSNDLTFFSNVRNLGTVGLAIDSDGVGPQTALAQDMNGDGRLELVVANNSDGRIALFAGDPGGLHLVQTIQSDVAPHPTALALVNAGGDRLGFYVGTAGVETAFFFQFDLGTDGSFLLQAALGQATVGRQVAELLPLRGDDVSLLQVATLLIVAGTPESPPIREDIATPSGGGSGDVSLHDEGITSDAASLDPSGRVTNQVIGISEAFDQIRQKSRQAEPRGDSGVGLASWRAALDAFFRCAPELDHVLGEWKPVAEALHRGVSQATEAVRHTAVDSARVLEEVLRTIGPPLLGWQAPIAAEAWEDISSAATPTADTLPVGNEGRTEEISWQAVWLVCASTAPFWCRRGSRSRLVPPQC